MSSIDFYFDPICPWCWITSKWLREVMARLDLSVTWRPFSLYVKIHEMEGGLQDEKARDRFFQAHQALRVMEAVRASLGEEVVDRLYVEYGRRFHHDGEKPVDHAAWIASAGLAPEWLDAQDDERWDEVILASMEHAFSLNGEEIGVPLIVFDDAHGFFGPVISPAPTGDDAVELFEKVEYLARNPWFHELKRTQRDAPEFGERP